MKHLCLALMLTSTYYVSHAQPRMDTVTNKTVIDLKSAGLSTDVIKAKIISSPCNFDISSDGLIGLKKSGLPDDVISYMVAKENQTNTIQAMMATAAKGRVDYQENIGKSNTVPKVEPGIYYSKPETQTPIELDPSIYSQSKKGAGVLGGLTGGISKTKTISTINGASANLQIMENKPVFMFYFDKSNASSSFGSNNIWMNTATSPNEFILVKFNTSKKNREVVTGSYGTYSGISSGIDDDNKVIFKYEKLTSGQYKVYFDDPLKPGEYGFVFAGSTTATLGTVQKVYDFGIK